MHWFLWFDSLSLQDIPDGPIMDPTPEQLEIFKNFAQKPKKKKDFRSIKNKEDFASLLTIEMFNPFKDEEINLEKVFQIK